MTVQDFRLDLPWAFHGMTSLVSIKLPKGMFGIGEKCFAGCVNLTTVVPTDELRCYQKTAFENTSVPRTTQDGVVYWENVAIDVVENYFTGTNTTVKIKDGTTVIADNLMGEGSESVTSLVMPSSLTAVGNNAFMGCPNLTFSQLPGNIKFIGEAAFRDCTALNNQSLTIPASIVEIRAEALRSAKSVAFEGTDHIEYLSTKSIPNTCESTETIDGVTYIGNVAFSSAKTDKTTLWLREGTTLVAEGFAMSLSNLEGCTKLHLPKSVKRINHEALYNRYSFGTTLRLYTSIKDIYIHSETPVILEAPFISYNFKVHLRSTAENAYRSTNGPWVSTLKNDNVYFDLDDMEFGGEVNAGIANTPGTAYTVEKARALIEAGVDLDTKVYVKGFITDIDEVSTDYGNATYTIADENSSAATNRLLVYRGKYLENEKFTEEDQIGLGDEVVVYGKLINYNGTYEFTSGNYIYSIKKAEKEPDVDISNTAETAYSTAKALSLIYKGEGLDTKVYVKGYITDIEEVSTDYGNATYTIANEYEYQDTTTCYLRIYRGKYFGGQKFTAEDQIKLGDEVVIYGKLQLYGNEPQMTSGSELWTINGQMPSAIDHITISEAIKARRVYDISGRRVNGALQKGHIYIIDKKKVIF